MRVKFGKEEEEEEKGKRKLQRNETTSRNESNVNKYILYGSDEHHKFHSSIRRGCFQKFCIDKTFLRYPICPHSHSNTRYENGQAVHSLSDGLCHIFFLTIHSYHFGHLH